MKRKSQALNAALFRIKNALQPILKEEGLNREKLIAALDPVIEQTQDEPGKLLGCMVRAIIANDQYYRRRDATTLEHLRLIFDGDFTVKLREEKPPLWSSDRIAPRHFDAAHASRYDQSLLYLPLSMTLNEKYGEDGIFLGHVAALLFTHTEMQRDGNGKIIFFTDMPECETFPGQEKLVEALRKHGINPWKDVTLLEVGGRHIKDQPAAELLQRCDSWDVFMPEVISSRKDFLLLDTLHDAIAAGPVNKYKFVVSSRVLEPGSRIARAGRESEDKLMHSCFAAMAGLLRKGGYAIHRELRSNPMHADKVFHQRLGVHSAQDELVLHGDVMSPISERITMYYKHQEMPPMPVREFDAWWQEKSKSRVTHAYR